MFLYLLGIVVFCFLYRLFRERRTISDTFERYVYITGCDSGFGNLLARRLDEKGFCVIASCLTERGAEELKKVSSERLSTVHLDVTKSDSVSKVAALVKEKVGTKGLWGLVNNAGVTIPTGPCDWLSAEDYRAVLNVNLHGLIAVTLSVLPLIKKARGRVVNVSSILGRLCLNGTPYCVSKGGVEAFSDGLRRDMAYFGVQVICVEPGFFKTSMANMDFIQMHFEKMWEKLPEETKADYGNDFLEKVRCLMKKSEAMLDPDLMKAVSCMEHGICALHPRTRYAPGWDAKLFWLPLSYMPAFIADFVCRQINVKPRKSLI